MTRRILLLLAALSSCGPASPAPPDAPATARDRRPGDATRRASITPIEAPATGPERRAPWLIPADGCTKSAAFGSAIAAADDRVLVTALEAEARSDATGDPPAACVFRRFEERFLLEGVLRPSSAALGAQFGRSALISGPHAAVGGSRAVHVFRSRKTGWELAHTFEPLRRKAAREGGVEFATALALHESELLIGSPDDAGHGRVQIHSLSASGEPRASQLAGTKDDRAFGSALAIDGDRLAVGADARATSGASGSASLFVRDRSGGWTLACRVESGEPGDRFGASIALGADRMVVGAPHATVRGIAQAGRVDVFTISGRGCARTATLVAPAPRVRGFFGSALDADERTLVAGEPGTGVRESEVAGRVFLFDTSAAGVRFSRELSTQASRPADRLGSSVALAPGSVWAGAPRAGAGYVIGSPLAEFGYLRQR